MSLPLGWQTGLVLFFEERIHCTYPELNIVTRNCEVKYKVLNVYSLDFGDLL